MALALKHEQWITLGRLILAAFESVQDVKVTDVMRLVDSLRGEAWRRLDIAPIGRLLDDEEALQEGIDVAMRYERHYRQFDEEFCSKHGLESALREFQRSLAQ